MIATTTSEPIVRLFLIASPKEGVRWLPLRETAIAFDNGYADTQLGMVVREPDGLKRPISTTELQQIQAIPGRWQVG